MTSPCPEAPDAARPPSAPDATGALFRLRVEPGPILSLFGPICAVLAGALAGRRPDLDGHDLLFILLAALLADPLLGGLWTAVAETDWWSPWEAAVEPSGAPGEGGTSLPPLPHAVPGSLAYRLVDSLARRASRWRTSAQTRLGRPLVQAGLLGAAAGGVALVLGPPVLLLVTASLAVCLLGALVPRYWGGDAGWLATAQHFTLPWAIGYAVAGGLLAGPGGDAGLALLLLVAYTVVYAGYRGLARQSSDAGGAAADLVQRQAGYAWPGAGRQLARLDGGQLLALALLVIAARPWQAGALGLLVLAQALWQPRWCRDRDSSRYLRGTVPFLVGGLLVAFA